MVNYLVVLCPILLICAQLFTIIALVIKDGGIYYLIKEAHITASLSRLTHRNIEIVA